MPSEAPSEPSSDPESVHNINEALNSEDIQGVLASWVESKEVLREQVRMFWMENETQFKMYWILCGEDIRKAMVLTAMEDLAQFEGAFTQSLCPELNSVEEILANNGNKVVELWETTVASKENDENTFSQKEQILEEFKNTIEQPDFAVEAMLSLRSNILLTFLHDISLIYVEQRNQT